MGHAGRGAGRNRMDGRRARSALRRELRSYDKTYGTLAGVIVFLIWLWISNVVILLGAEFNAELERSREIEAGQPEGRSRSSSRATRAS